MIYLKLIWEFFKIGLFSFGGGYATIPFLYDLSARYGWYSIRELKNMIAVASVTPGPVGINAATYAGIKVSGVLGALCTTVSEMLPSLILVVIVSKLLRKFSENFYVKSVIASLKPISCALLTSAAVGLIKPSLGDIKGLILLGVLLIISRKSKKDPLFYILISGIIGVLFTFFKY